MDYYRFLGLEPRLDLDLRDLESRFYRISRDLHPDRYARRSLQERRAAEDATARLNDAYRTLKDPIARAEYFLKQQGINGRESPELLEEVFDWNLELEELKKEGDTRKLDSARARFQGLEDQLFGDLEGAFRAADRAPSAAAWEAVRALLNRRKYLHNVLKELTAPST